MPCGAHAAQCQQLGPLLLLFLPTSSCQCHTGVAARGRLERPRGKSSGGSRDMEAWQGPA
jgi:hypothetical protein